MLTGEQVRAARAMLQLEQTEVAELAGVSVETIKRIEKFKGRIKATVETNARIRAALEEKGVDFIGHGHATGNGGPGVRLSLDHLSKVKSAIYGLLRNHCVFAVEEVNLLQDVGADNDLDVARMCFAAKDYMERALKSFEKDVRDRI